MKMQQAPSYPSTQGEPYYSSYTHTGSDTVNTYDDSLNDGNLTDAKHAPSDLKIRLGIGFLLVGASYLLFQVEGGFPPWAWRFLFEVLPRLPSLWDTSGLGILFPLIGLLLLSISLLIVWGLIIFGIGWSLVRLWSTYRQQSNGQTDRDESLWALEEQAHQIHSVPTHPDREDVPIQEGQQLFEYQPQELQQPLAQQVQPLRGGASTYAPMSQNRRPQARRTHLQLVSEQDELAQLFPEVPEDEEWFIQEQEGDELELDTRPVDVSEEQTMSPYIEWDDEQEATLRLVIGIGLDPGLVRKDRPNEDSLFAIQGIRTTKAGSVPAGLFIVADGMGGHANGADASRMAVREVSNVIVPTLLRDESDGSEDEDDEQEFFLGLLKDGVYRANLVINRRNQTIPNMMGTTITTALVVDSTAYIINVGDSRTYLYRAAEGLVQITRDHSTVARLVEEGEIKPSEIYTHPQRNQIYRCLGEDATVEMDTFVVPLQPDDILLLCSDGLWEMVRDPIIEKIVTSSSHLPAQISNILVQAALNQGGVDNISVVVVGVVKTTL